MTGAFATTVPPCLTDLLYLLSGLWIPAFAGMTGAFATTVPPCLTDLLYLLSGLWIPAFAGMTEAFATTARYFIVWVSAERRMARWILAFAGMGGGLALDGLRQIYLNLYHFRDGRGPALFFVGGVIGIFCG